MDMRSYHLTLKAGREGADPWCQEHNQNAWRYCRSLSLWSASTFFSWGGGGVLSLTLHMDLGGLNVSSFCLSVRLPEADPETRIAVQAVCEASPADTGKRVNPWDERGKECSQGSVFKLVTSVGMELTPARKLRSSVEHKIRDWPHAGQEDRGIYTPTLWLRADCRHFWPSLHEGQTKPSGKKKQGLTLRCVAGEHWKGQGQGEKVGYWQHLLYLPSSARSQVHQSSHDWSGLGAWPVQGQCKSFPDFCAWKDRCCLSAMVAEWGWVSLELPLRPLFWPPRKAYLQEERIEANRQEEEKENKRERSHIIFIWTLGSSLTWS